MTEILCALWWGTAMIIALFFLCREKKLKDDRESHELWLSNLRECIHNIEWHFSRDCEKIITDAFSGRNIKGKIIIDEYRKAIDKLKNEYSNNLYEKIVTQKGKYGIKSVPEHLANEYERNISEIADTFRNIGDFMLEQIKDITKGDYHWKMNF